MLLTIAALAVQIVIPPPVIASHSRGADMWGFQFRATDNLGNPVADGNYPTIFTLYAVPAGGTVLWAETLSVATTDGLAFANLGLIHAFSSDIVESAILQNNNNNGFLEVTFNGETIVPRFRVAAAPYAKVSDRIYGDIQTGPDQLRVGDDSSPLQTYCDMSTDGGGWTIVASSSDTIIRVDTSGMKIPAGEVSVGTPPAVTFNGTDYLVVWESGGIDTAIHVNPNGIAIGPNAANGLAVGAPAAVNARLLPNALALRNDADELLRIRSVLGVRSEITLYDLAENITLDFTTTEISYVNSTDDKKVKLPWNSDNLLYKIDGTDTAGISSTAGNLGLFVAPGKTLSVPATGGSVNIAAPATLASLSCPDVDMDGTLDLATVIVTATSSDIYLDPASTFDCAGTATFDNPVHIGGGAPPPPGSFLHVNGNITATGAKLFVQEHPKDPEQYIAFVALEGPEAGTYTRGSYQLINGTAEIKLPESFTLVTGEEGLTVQVTPRGKVSGMLYVESISPSLLVVRASDESDMSARFDYLVNGVRIGYENFESIRKAENTAGDVSLKLSSKE